MAEAIAVHPVARTAEGRIASIDILRGLVMALMALDHTRDFFGTAASIPARGAALFLTRWVTHLCAPTFTFSPGSNFLYEPAKRWKHNASCSFAFAI
jgi:uncharacterized membrane protein